MKDPLLYSGQFARGDLSSWNNKNKVSGRRNETPWARLCGPVLEKHLRLKTLDI